MTSSNNLAASIGRLSAVLEHLATAMALGDSMAVLAVESDLADAVARCQREATGPPLPSAGAVAMADIDALQRALARCRRLGGTVPGLLSVMFPGQVGYGPAGQARTPMGVFRPGRRV